MRQVGDGVGTTGTRSTDDPCLLLAQLGEALTCRAALPVALDLLVTGLGVSTAVVRGADGDLLGVGGEALHAVPSMRTLPLPAASVELPLRGGTLTVLGARPSQLTVLRAAAAIIGLALTPATSAARLLDDAEEGLDEIADGLHDGPVQALVVARYAADAAARGADPSLVRDAVQEGLVALRRSLWALRPRGEHGLLSALEQLSAQLVERGAPTLTVLGETDLSGSPAVLAYRLVQSLSGEEHVRVALRLEGSSVVVTIDGGVPLTSPDRWVRRARALGCDLSASAGRLRLVLSPPAPRGDDARTLA